VIKITRLFLIIHDEDVGLVCGIGVMLLKRGKKYRHGAALKAIHLKVLLPTGQALVQGFQLGMQLIYFQ
jgi:hypothetical protein